ncbi:MAG: FISUMP domain-containing protein [bacterium]
MKLFLTYLLMFAVWVGSLTAQTITGLVLDETVTGLKNYQVKLFIAQEVYTTQTNIEGFFTINLTEVKEETLPENYSISNNFPNPFNPTTRINFLLPQTSTIQVEIFNTIGQNVGPRIEKEMQAGNNYIDLELNGLPNGVYFAKINVNDQYTVVRKLMLLYGSQHLSAINQIGTEGYSKSTNNTYIDSIVVSAGLIRTKTFVNLPELTGQTLDIGFLQMQISCPDIQTIEYLGKTYHTVQIGNQCWLKENLNVGTKINSTDEQTNNNIIEKYCYNNNEANCDTNGGLYQWNEALNYTASGGNKQGICPTGWHIPTFTEFETLKAVVNNDGNKLIREDQGTGSGTNTSGFSGLFAGYRSNDGYFSFLGEGTYFWSSTENDAPHAYYLALGESGVSLYDVDKEDGFSVRCLQGSIY